MKTRSLFLIAAAVSIPMPAALAADDPPAWPQWRGPGGNGVVQTGKPPIEWSEERNVRWKMEVPGSGTSTPIVAGDRIFLLTAETTGKKVPVTAGEESDTAADDAAEARPRRERPQRDGDRENADEPAGPPEENRPDRGGRRGGFGAFDEDGPLPEFARAYDKDENGKLDEAEREAMREAFQARRGGGGEGRRGGRGRGGFGGGEAPDEVHRFSVICLDRKTGDTVWTKAVREEVPHEGHHRDHGYASASPVTDGEHLYAHFGSRGLYCLDMDGNIKWEKDLGDMRTAAGFGEGASPALADGLLIVKWDHEGDSFIAALDKATGDERWRKERDESTSWSTPLVVEHEGVKQVIAAATGKVVSYDLKNGDSLWESTGMTRNVIPTPVTGDGIVYVTSGFRGSALQAIDLGARGKIAKDNGLLWSHDEGTPYVPSPLLFEGRLYFFQGNDNRLSCLDAKTGEAHYSRENVEGLRGIYASPIGVNGHVYLVGRQGSVVVLKSGDALQIVATNSLDDEFDAAPVVVGDELLLRGKKHLYCLAQGGDA